MYEALKTFTQTFPVYRHDGDHLGNCKVGALLRYAQQIATVHAEAVGLTDEVYAATHTAYVLARLALHIDRVPQVDEILTVTTEPELCKHAVNKRITRFVDAHGAQAAVMDSRWVLIDTQKRTILRSHPPQFETPWAGDVPFSLPMKLAKAASEDCEPVGEYRATYSRCDKNGHLNNTRYADIVCDALPLSVWQQGTVQEFMIFYHREVPLGETFSLARAQTGPLQYYFSGEREGKSAFEASISFTD